ncbi:MAG: LppX_LprAFG lipoprotein [Chloroflexi bacterium]|nr:LppX_LprAFG lipoprotein [Chloroflexota bacterium]
MELSIKSLLASLLVVGLLVACGSEKATEPPDGLAGVDAQQAMEQAVDQLLALESASFNLEHLEGATELFPGVSMSRAYGEVSIPDRFLVTVEAESKFPRSYIEISIITIDEASYMTAIISGLWSEVPTESLPFNLSGLGQTLADIVAAVEQPRAIRAERLHGIDTLLIKGDIASEGLSALVPGAGEGFSVGLDLWLEKNGLPRQVDIVGRVVPTDDEDTIRRLTLDDINQPVSIDPPI